MCTIVGTLDDHAVVFRDEVWTVGIVVDVPGWLMIVRNDHVEGVEGLDDDEAAAFGRLAARLGRALKEVCDAERVYLMYQGEHAAHFHAMVMARGRDVPAEWRGAALLSHRDELADPEGSRRVVTEVRRRLT